MKKILSILVLSSLFIVNVLAEEADVYYCKLKNPYEASKDKYEYTIILEDMKGIFQALLDFKSLKYRLSYD